MSLTTYSGLLTAIATTLNRSDLTDYIPDWVQMAESVLNRKLNARTMIVTETITISGDTYALPSGFSGVESFWLDVDTGVPLEYVTLDVFDNVTNTSGEPRYYTVSGDSFYFAPPPTGDYTARLRYKKNLTPLSTDNPSNWVLEQHPDLYLYGALVHSAPFLNDDQRLLVWEGKFKDILDETNRYYSRVDRGSRLQTSSGLIDRGFNPSGYNTWR